MPQHCSHIAFNGRARRVLFVGAERLDEFADALRLLNRGHKVLVINPRETTSARRFLWAGGRFLRARVEHLPPRYCQFDLICENYPYPSGRHYVPPRPFALARLLLLAPGGRWVLFTESVRFASLLKAVIDYDIGVQGKFHAALSSISQTDAPPSTYPSASTRFRLVFERCV